MFEWLSSLFVLGALIKEEVDIGVAEQSYKDSLKPYENRKKYLDSELSKAYRGEFSPCFDRPDECRWLQRALFRTIVQEGVLFYKMETNPISALREVENMNCEYLFVPDYSLWFVRDENGEIKKDENGNYILTTELERWKFAKTILESGAIDNEGYWFTYKNTDCEKHKFKWYDDTDPYVPTNIRYNNIPHKFIISKNHNRIERNYGSEENAYLRTHKIIEERCLSVNSADLYREFGLDLNNVIFNNCIGKSWSDDNDIVAELKHSYDVGYPNKYFRILSDGEKSYNLRESNRFWTSSIDYDFNYNYGNTFKNFPMNLSVYDSKYSTEDNWKNSKKTTVFGDYFNCVPDCGFRIINTEETVLNRIGIGMKAYKNEWGVYEPLRYETTMFRLY